MVLTIHKEHSIKYYLLLLSCHSDLFCGWEQKCSPLHMSSLELGQRTSRCGHVASGE